MLDNLIVHNRVVRMRKLYSTTAHATGDGRNGHVSSDDGIIDLDVRMPEELGGTGDATNPEQLFAAGYSACFHSALRLVATEAGVDVTDSAVSATVHLVTTAEGGFGIGVELDVSLPDTTTEQAHQVVEQAHRVCPYSNATRDNIEVHLSVV